MTTAFASMAATLTVMLCIVAIMVVSNYSVVMAFAPTVPSKYASHRLARPLALAHITCSRNNNRLHTRGILQMAAAKSDKDLQKEISAMKAKQIRQELEAYGIPTQSFFEKSELVEALVNARKVGKTPVDGANGAGATASDDGSSGSSSSSSSSTSNGGGNRQERIKKEMEKCKQMKVGELKKELQSAGVSTKSFFEKSEFVRAVAELRVDGPKKTAGASGSRVNEEPRDPSYRDVSVSKFSGDKGLLLGGGVIDVKAR